MKGEGSDDMVSDAGSWVGHDLGHRTVRWEERDVILFALAVGARPTQLDLVFEQRLRVLPTFALTLAQWAPDQLSAAGAFDPRRALHGAQRVEVLQALPPSGETTMHARVANVWDKGRAAVFEVEVECPFLRATWSIFADGLGGFGGQRGPARAPEPTQAPMATVPVHVDERAAALYRLTGDRHLIHIDPAAARAIGHPRPILHGLATLSTTLLAIAEHQGADPVAVRHVEARFSGPVYPGEAAHLLLWEDGRFRLDTDRGPALDGGRVAFAGAGG